MKSIKVCTASSGKLTPGRYHELEKKFKFGTITKDELREYADLRIQERKKQVQYSISVWGKTITFSNREEYLKAKNTLKKRL